MGQSSRPVFVYLLLVTCPLKPLFRSQLWNCGVCKHLIVKGVLNKCTYLELETSTLQLIQLLTKLQLEDKFIRRSRKYTDPTEICTTAENYTECLPSISHSRSLFKSCRQHPKAMPLHSV